MTTTDDGRPISINVEQIGGSLIIQHYVAEVLTPHRCVLVSMSDSITPRGRIKIHVTWELDFLREVGVTFEQAAAERSGALAAHNRIETPLYARSVERRALGARAAAVDRQGE